MRFLILLFIAFATSSLTAQTQEMNIPYHQIPEYPENHTSENMLARMIDGLGYRLYWATEDLREEDINYKPEGESTKTVEETMEHLMGLSNTIYNVVFDLPNIRPYEKIELDFNEMRKISLEKLKMASDKLRSGELKVEDLKIVFQRGEQSSSFPIWNLINGPIADAIYHTGQLVSYRRSSGNPMSPLVNVFMGKNRAPKN